jgi:hypothetical protein
MRYKPVGDKSKKVFTAVWTTPALCFFVFIFLKFVNSGYLLLVLPAGCIWLGFWIAGWYRESPLGRRWKLVALGMGATANVLIYLFAPLYCSYRSVRLFEAELSQIRQELPREADPSNTLIVGFDSHFLGYRHAGYYLPGYLTLEYPEVKLVEGTRIFSMQDRETHLIEHLPVSKYSRFVVFPLPNEGLAYDRYRRKIEGKLPRQDLSSIRVGNHDFVTAPISDLAILFPKTAARDKGVYPPLHSGGADVYNRAHLGSQTGSPSPQTP